MEPSKQDLVKIEELQNLIKERLVSHNGLTETVRQAVAKYGADATLLLKFLRGRKFNIDRAADSIFHYADIKYNRYPELFPEMMPQFAHYAFDEGVVSVLKHKDDLGRTIVVFGGRRWDLAYISLEELICAGRYLVEALMENPDFLTKGAILITDSAHATLSHARQLTVANVLRFLGLFWQAYPVQIKGLYFVNSPMVMRALFPIMKPFVPAKLKDRIILTSGVSELHKRVPVDILPKTLGGPLELDEALVNPTFHRTSDL